MLINEQIFLSRAESFIQAHNLKSIEKIPLRNSKNDGFFAPFFNVTPVTISHLDRLYFYTIYNNDCPFSLIDFLLERTVPGGWIESKLALSADEIEAHFKNLKSSKNICELEFLEKWIERQPQGKPVDSDLLALRTLETLILMAIVNFQNVPESQEQAAFKILEEKLMDWSEAAGLIRSISSDYQLSQLAETSMDIDFNPSAETSAFFALNPTEFDSFFLCKLKKKGCLRRFKEIVEIVADRCGIPVDSEAEDQAIVKAPLSKEPKHWRRVKPEPLPIKRIASSKVTRPSSLSVTELKSHRFLSSTSTNSSRQVDLTLKQHQHQHQPSENNPSRRSHSESSPQIIQQTTPTKSKKSFNLVTNAGSTANTLADSFVILETPPRALSKKFVQENDLTGSVRRLFPSQPMDEE